MPVYDFKCKECDEIKENLIMSITHKMEDHPRCESCDKIMTHHITKPPSVIWVDPVIEPFRAVGTKDDTIITTTRQNREYMARNDLVDANELYTPPTQQEQMQAHEEALETIDAITPNEQQLDQLKDSGLDSIL